MIWHSLDAILLWVLWIGCFLWAAVTPFALWRALRFHKSLSIRQGDEIAFDEKALVSVLVPARNEEQRALRFALLSILSQDYSPLEVIAVDDRSTDATYNILCELATKENKLKVIKGVEPTNGWTGKPFALQQALDSSKGDWILATDADIIYSQEAVRVAVSHAEAGRYDAISLLPRIDSLSFWERVFMPVFGSCMMFVLPLDRVNDPTKSAALGIGAFFMIRRQVLDRLSGFESVKSELVEDVKMAENLKKAGARLHVEHAPNLLRTRMQTDFKSIWEGFTKNIFVGARLSGFTSLLVCLITLIFTVFPAVVAYACFIILIFVSGDASSIHYWLAFLIPAALTYLMQTISFAVIDRRSDVPVWYSVTAPLGFALLAAILFNSTIKIISGKGVMWKGRRLYRQNPQL
ncbi:MAG: glycosyltransferase [Pyrinomonadaceae bacterium]